MAGFFPHVGNTNLGGFTPLPMVPVTGFLDSLVSDLTSSAGGGVNGWSMYDDMRGAAGTANPMYPRIYSGQMAASWNAGYNAYSWKFTTGSQQVSGNITYGFELKYGISGDINNLTPISTDLTNWYNIYYLNTVGNFSTGILDQNFKGATGNYNLAVYTKVTKQVVLQCSSSQKTFYVLMGQATERAGGPVLYTQVYETWSTGSHTGTVSSSLEHTRFILEGNVSRSGALVQYMAWFLPGAFGLWTQGRINNPGASLATPVPTASISNFTEVSCFSFIGNLDTTDGLGSGSDPDALAFIPGDTSHSGYHATPNAAVYFPSTNSYYMAGAVQCLRTLDGTVWNAPAVGLGQFNKKNGYTVSARGRTHQANAHGPMTDISKRQWFAEMDVWHMGATDSIRDNRARDIQGLRGKIPFVKTPVHQPGVNQLSTFGPCSDGFSYVLFKTQQFASNYYNNTITPGFFVQQTSGFIYPAQTGWAVSGQDSSFGGATTAGAVEDFYHSARSFGFIYTYLAMPIY